MTKNKIAAVCTAYNEPDILPWTIAHLLPQVDRIYIEMPEGDHDTLDAIAKFDIDIWIQEEEYHDQPHSITTMGQKAATELGGEDLWILPFDADEFIIQRWLEWGTLREALELIPKDTQVIDIQRSYQKNRDYRANEYVPDAKVAYRFSPDYGVGLGNHWLYSTNPHDPIRHRASCWALREIHYRSFEHFKRKIVERNRTIDPNQGPENGWHHKIFANASERELEEGFSNGWLNKDWVYDPIPTTVDLPMIGEE